MKINKHDTQGTKPLLGKGELGYDDYVAGGDVGRVYVGTGSENIALAEKSEIDSHVNRVDNPHSVTKAQVGLGNVDNTADANKNVFSTTKWTTARTLSLTGDVAGNVSFDGSADVTLAVSVADDSHNHAFGNLTGKPTTVAGYGITDVYTKAQTDSNISTAVAGLVNGAPATLDTLNELAAALGNDANFAATTSTALGNRVIKNADIVAGTGTKVTYDAKGLVTGSTTLSTTDIPSLDAGKITTGVFPVSVGGTGVATLTGIVKGNGTGAMTAAIAGTDYVIPSGSITGNAGTATALATVRTIGMTGDVTWTSASFNGSANVTGTSTLATITDSGTGTFKKITTDTKGRVTGTQAVAQADIIGLLGAGSITNTMIANTAVANLSGTNTGDQTITLTGDVTGSGTGSFATTLANSGVTAGTYSKVTVDTKGRITSGTNPTTLAGYSISDAYSKTEVDSLVQGFKPKAEVRVATTTDITLSGTQTIDGITVAAGDRVLVKNQTTGSQNGIYNASATAWTRAIDSDTATELAGSYCFISQGMTQADTGWYMNTDSVVLGTTSLTWIQFTGSGAYAPISHVGSTGASHGVATISINGFMSSADKTKLDGIATNANNYSHPVSGVSTGTYKSVTVDINGHVTGGSNPTTLLGYGISDTYTKTEVDSLIGDINSALDTINGQVI